MTLSDENSVAYKAMVLFIFDALGMMGKECSCTMECMEWQEKCGLHSCVG